MKAMIALISMVCVCFGYSDVDMDGVEDAKDRCPYTPLSDLVDDRGCSITSVDQSIHYDVAMGIGYSQVNYASQEKANTLTTSFQSNFYDGRETFTVATSYFRSHVSGVTESGLNDTFIGYSVKSLEKNNWTFTGGVGMILPTYNSGYKNEAIDFSGSFSARYRIGSDVSLFGGFSYTIVNDKNVKDVVSYQNTQSFYGGISSMLTPTISLGTSYQQSESIYTDIDVLKTLSLNGFYQIDDHWFTLMDYRYGLSESASDHDISLRVGYYF